MQPADALLVPKHFRLLRILKQQHPSFLHSHPCDSGANLPFTLCQCFVAKIARCSSTEFAFFTGYDASTLGSQCLDCHVENVGKQLSIVVLLKQVTSNTVE